VQSCNRPCRSMPTVRCGESLPPFHLRTGCQSNALPARGPLQYRSVVRKQTTFREGNRVLPRPP
jgi:hypothetical protein